MGIYSGGLIIGRIFASEICFREGLILVGLTIGNLRYMFFKICRYILGSSVNVYICGYFLLLNLFIQVIQGST